MRAGCSAVGSLKLIRQEEGGQTLKITRVIWAVFPGPCYVSYLLTALLCASSFFFLKAQITASDTICLERTDLLE
jgi:hypothetical protein